MLGPADGRYVLRGHAGEPEFVLVLETIGAPPRRRRRSRFGRSAGRAEPSPAISSVPVTVATLVGAAPIGDPDTAAAWLASTDLQAEVARAVDVLNGVLHAQRVVRADPFVREVAAEQALAIRVGIGRGDDVAHGHWEDALLVDPPALAVQRRVHALRPQERFAALLAGRDVALAAEELTLRARLDLDRGRTREAALQLRVALEAALSELQAWSHHAEMARRLDELRDERGAVAGAANRALEGGLEPAQITDVERAVGRLEAALAARVAGGLE
ncbi:hypothetical protein DSM104299_04627 [Baekduia alba]|nr:hypothetical protein DSM104299_04627 [Baekduia alba]